MTEEHKLIFCAACKKEIIARKDIEKRILAMMDVLPVSTTDITLKLRCKTEIKDRALKSLEDAGLIQCYVDTSTYGGKGRKKIVYQKTTPADREFYKLHSRYRNVYDN